MSISAAEKDRASMTPDWLPLKPLPEGVGIKAVRHIVTGNGITTELYRAEWKETVGPLGHAIRVRLDAGAVSAWHCHRLQTDAIQVIEGRVLLALYDDREESSSYRMLSTLRLDAANPQTVVVPPGVWHGLQNLLDTPTSFVNLIDREYCYEDPDEYRLPPDTPEIPFQFPA